MPRQPNLCITDRTAASALEEIPESARVVAASFKTSLSLRFSLISLWYLRMIAFSIARLGLMHRSWILGSAATALLSANEQSLTSAVAIAVKWSLIFSLMTNGTALLSVPF